MPPPQPLHVLVEDGGPRVVEVVVAEVRPDVQGEGRGRAAVAPGDTRDPAEEAWTPAPVTWHRGKCLQRMATPWPTGSVDLSITRFRITLKLVGLVLLEGFVLNRSE